MEQDRSRISVLSKAQGSFFLVFHSLHHEGASLGPIYRPAQRNSRSPAHGGPETCPSTPLGMGGDYPEQGSDRIQVR